MFLIQDYNNIQGFLELQYLKKFKYWGFKLEVCGENNIGFKIKRDNF